MMDGWDIALREAGGAVTSCPRDDIKEIFNL